MNTYLNNLLGYKKKKTRHLFRWKVVEAYRAEKVQDSELEETLGISRTELRSLNRNYFRHRLLPLLHPKNRLKHINGTQIMSKCSRRNWPKWKRGTSSYAYKPRPTKP